MLLDNINNPQELKKLSLDELPILAAEIRQKILEVVSRTGGHLASSLGAVELAIALHYCLDTPEDKIIWDVGHQAYAHKILTGRCKDFNMLRQYQGLTGFPCKEESPYDPFTTGHSSTAVSLALGLASARDITPAAKFRVAAVIGDGSLSGGLCFEGLNNAGHLKKDLLVVLNTNEMSIAPNVGAISNYLNKLISQPIYNRFKDSFDKFVESRIPKGSRLVKIANKFEKGLKELFIPGVLFEELGFRYFGPFDGHNLNSLIPTIKKILTIKGPVLLHVITKKGKGYAPAENDPVRFHSVGPFEIATGKGIAKVATGQKTFTAAFSEALVSLARENRKMVAITAAMPEGTGMDKFRDLYPERFFDVGIAEGHAVTFAAGLARQGLKPVIAIYSTFLQRAYDQIIESVALQNLGVIFCLDRAGVVGEDGATHQGVFDICFLRTIPNLAVMAPADAAELEAMLAFAVDSKFPVSIRYPKAQAPSLSLPLSPIELGKAQLLLQEGQDYVIIALGSMVAPCIEAAQLLKNEGFQGTLINARFVKPLDQALFKMVSSQAKFIFTVEDGVIEGGFGSAVTESTDLPVIRIGLPDEFMPCGARGVLLKKYGLTSQGIADTIRSYASIKLHAQNNH
ncbi:MAG: 1-deoxy-D-xylulose-5-phosphate synthase [Candidatus Omnitrophica bacterium]|nr:1-deoxy-D-xylulose-5-phosphate synthase [Candidatus Omnitrophota bacterium]